jgi:nucleoside-diphosphate-sugar epimerase
MATVLIAGCGYVGTALGLRLAADGHWVLGLRRSDVALPGPIELFYADVTVPASLPDLPDPEVVFYMVSAGASTDEEYEAVYVTGIRNLLSHFEHAQHRPRRLFFISSTGVYGQTDGAWVDENSPAASDRFSGKRLREGEEVAWAAPYPATVVRFGGIYGPGRTRLIDSVREGTAVCTEGEPVYINLIHREDCAGCLRHLMRLDNPANLYIGVDHEPADRSTIIRWVAGELGLPAPPVVAHSRRQTGNKRCRNSRLVGSGYEFMYPTYREGYRDML